ncbi:MAG: TRAP transporter small permease [Rhizobiaceae bacterium]
MGPKIRKRHMPSGLLKNMRELMIVPPYGERTTVIDHVVSTFSRFAMLLIMVGAGITLFEIVMRYVFASPTSWVHKSTLWLAAVTYLMSGILVMQRREHIRVTVIYDAVSPTLRLIFDLLGLYVLIVYATLMLVGSADLVWAEFFHAIKTGAILSLPLSATIKPLLLFATVAVAIVAINNHVIDHLNFGRSSHSKRRGDKTQ